ncbi:MAG: LacI family DNA-binding transcriptional regulator [Pirellulaceae bacterium]
MTSTIEIAEAVGVSQATVSRVINNQAGVAPSTVKLVREAIQRLGYHPRPRRARKSMPEAKVAGNVAVLLLDQSCERHPTLAMAKLRGVEKALTAAGMNMILAHATQDDPVPPVLDQLALDGALLWGHRGSEILLAKLRDIPAVWLSSHVGNVSDAVSQGNATVGRLAADYLLGRGHTQLAFLNVCCEHPGFIARGEGFAFAAHMAGHEIQRFAEPPGTPFEQRNSRELELTLRPLVDQVLSASPRPTGLFLPDDQITAVVYRCLQRAKVKVGREIEIVSCNNEEPYLAGLHPRPATIDLGPELTGRRAVEQLLANIQNPEADSRRVEVIVEPLLIEGERWQDLA